MGARRGLHGAEGLLAAGLVDEGDGDALRAVCERYSVALTPHVAALVEDERRRGGPAAGALALQYVPSPEELASGDGEQPDPTGDGRHTPLPGIVHRYPDRVLLMPHGSCAVYCRFCFRRERVGPGRGALSREALAAALAWIEAHPEIWEVILSGGDPLLLGSGRLQAILTRLDAIDHVEVIRLHTRIPVAMPGRVDERLVGALSGPKARYVVIHVNHPDELTPEVRHACAAFVDRGIPVLSQSVLLAGVNDRAEVLERLFRCLVAWRIRPYYLHHLDAAPGTGHFRVPLERGQALMRDLRGRVSGLCQPQYVLDVPGGYGKIPVGPAWVCREPGGGYRLTDPEGREHEWKEPVPGPRERPAPGESGGHAGPPGQGTEGREEGGGRPPVRGRCGPGSGRGPEQGGDLE